MAKKTQGNGRGIPQGSGGETQQRGGPVLTTNHGVPISDNQNSLKAGQPGPTLLEDFVLREKIFHFDHERIPERIVHARGTGAHGFFECTDPIPELTRASLFQKRGAKVPVFVRFSTVAGSKGSKDTPRDVRGFAVKFYTEEGNWDLVGNNIPVFFIQDAMKFPDLIHAVKPEADRGFPQAASAHDTFWDFVSLMPESLHMIMWAMSDRAIPRSLRMMEGFGVHTFHLVNAEGEATMVKFHWKPKLGMQSTTWDEAVKISGADPDYHRRDLYEAIQAGDCPEWELGIQIFDQDWADRQPYDVLDPTKLIPEEEVPVRIVGRLVLDRYPDNFFAETEQVAFLPSNVVPGIDFSNDPLLQGRLFSYLDTQKSRLGTTNFHQIPINAPKCPMHNFQRDGMMQVQVPKGRANYEPNSLDEAGEDPGPRASDQGFVSVAAFTEPAEEKRRIRPESFADHFSQARLFFVSQTEAEQNHIIAAIVFELSKVQLKHVRKRVLAQLRNIDESMAQRIADGLGAELPPALPPAKAPVDLPVSDALSILKHPAPVEGRCLGVLVSDGADGPVVEALKSAASAAGATVKIVAPKVGGVKLKGGELLEADEKIDGAPSVLFDAIALVLSPEGADQLAGEKAALDFVSDAYAHCKAIGHTGPAKPLLDKAGVVQDGFFFDLSGSNAEALIEKLPIRDWSREKKVKLPV
ncbi:catalase [Rhizobiaceae bacterium BDR2-2]|uniref:Catalase n=1 Tax=Ectorhizobium quercum TaxID=2965071 RepID=A0AAE3MZP4_9HYPH|nr:catalase [Ectorhizobium quercum]MCX8997406.1 catalase [Ectorhizobium quercum]